MHDLPLPVTLDPKKHVATGHYYTFAEMISRAHVRDTRLTTASRLVRCNLRATSCDDLSSTPKIDHGHASRCVCTPCKPHTPVATLRAVVHSTLPMRLRSLQYYKPAAKCSRGKWRPLSEASRAVGRLVITERVESRGARADHDTNRLSHQSIVAHTAAKTSQDAE